MIVNNFLFPEYFYNSAGEKLKLKELTIPSWNMETTSYVIVNHGLSDYTNIKQINCWIRDDAGSAIYNFTYSYYISVLYIDTTDIVVFREVGSPFEASTFSSVAFNRGRLHLWHVEE